MADAGNFVHLYTATIKNMISNFDDLQTMNQQITDDPTLATRFAAITPNQPNYRGDINWTDITNAQNAIVQILFAYNSGNPTQASFLLKVLP